MSKQKTTATSARKGFLVILLLVIIGIGAGFYYGLQMIRDYAIETTKKVADAGASGRQIEQLRQLQQTLQQSDALLIKADAIFATEANYRAKAITDLNRYAGAAGVTITSTEFPTPEPASPPNVRPATITLAQPVRYESLLRFLQLVEGNLPKMQPINLTISRPDQPNGTQVTVSTITINISTRQ